MKLEPGSYCPLVKENCIQLRCGWYMQLRGKHPQTGEEIDDWGCAICFTPLLLIENSQQQRHTSAAVESFRNEMVKANEASIRVLAEAVERENQASRISNHQRQDLKLVGSSNDT